ncbi:MAG: DUF523 domain-containing protein [Clostridia bacterium]|nr:DUF523 domain-containing protein [Clostridia bacterium]
MKILVSACLLGENCKYSGGNNRNERVLEYVKGHEVIPICPEVMGGLSTPRPPAEIVDGVVINKEGVNVDLEYRLGAQRALEIALREGAEAAILQSRSPSCGVREIYDGTFSGARIPGMGVTARLLKEHGIRVLDARELLKE